MAGKAYHTVTIDIPDAELRLRVCRLLEQVNGRGDQKIQNKGKDAHKNNKQDLIPKEFIPPIFRPTYTYTRSSISILL